MMTKTSRLAPAANVPPPVYTVEFEAIDLNQDGNITKDEFSQIPQTPEIDGKTPVLLFVILVLLIGAMVYLTKLIKNKD
jgi:hypothetical protein